MLYLFDTCRLDTERRELCRANVAIAVEPQVFDLLHHLVCNRGRVVSKDELIASVWGGRIVSDSALDTRIAAARAAIGDSGAQQTLIKTFPKKGIRFVGEVREEPAPGSAAVAESANVSSPLVYALPDRPSIAILPFTNMSADPEQDYFADGMAQEIITALSRCSWLFVIARNSSFSYKGRTTDVRQIGRELGVRYVLDGSVRRAGERLRITGQLTDTVSGTTVWADRFDGERLDVFELQDQVTGSVVAAIEPSLQRAEIERIKHKTEANLDAYDLFLKAQQQQYEFTEASIATAIRLLEQALSIDAAYAPAMALGSYCYAQRRFQGWEKDSQAEETVGLRLANCAIEMAKDDPNVLWMAGYAIRELGMDTVRSQELINRSLHLNPNSAIALTIAGWNEIILEMPVKALDSLARAERLSPRDPRAWFMATARALAHLSGGQYQHAAASARRALAQNPRSAQALRLLASSLARTGDTGSARQAMTEVLRIDPQLTRAKLRARLAFMPESLWNNFAEGLHIAGLPE